ncbi:hypothetical protein [Streptomyces sp. NPDC014744]|uniref:hypothetical protein n=1 Tax=Streptomyces sp. NPDC014744 TaxID=3364903 RepID=UPI0036FEAC33
MPVSSRTVPSAVSSAVTLAPFTGSPCAVRTTACAVTFQGESEPGLPSRFVSARSEATASCDGGAGWAKETWSTVQNALFVPV